MSPAFTFRALLHLAFAASLLAISPAQSFTANIKEVHNSMPERGGKRQLSVNLHVDLLIGDSDEDDGAPGNEYTFGQVYDIGVDSKCRIYVVDNGFGRIQQYDSSGTFVRTIGRSGEGPGEYSSPFAVAVGGNDELYVVSQGRVSIFGDDGRYIREFRDGLTGVVRKAQIAGQSLYVSCFELFDQTIIHTYDVPTAARVRSFCDSYAVGRRVDTRVEVVFAGGTFDIEQGLIYYTQLNPYEVRLYSLAGRQTAVVYRENDFMHDPIVEPRGDGGMHFGPLATSVSIIAFRDGKFMNVIIVPIDDNTYETVLDVFSEQGALLATERLKGSIPLRCKDKFGRLYAIDFSTVPKVARYRFELR